MHRVAAVVLAFVLIAPAITQAQESMLASAERLAAETTLQPQEFRRSTGRTTIGIAMAAAGAVMMLLDPEQPTQPGTISRDALRSAAVGRFSGVTAADVLAARRLAGVTTLVCEPFCIGAIDEAILGSFVVGTAAGIVSVETVIEDSGYEVYAGQFQPFKKRNAGLKYGGAALAVAGAAIAALWSTVPVARDIRVAPTPGGLAVGTGFGF